MKVNLMDVIDAIDTINEDETYFYSIQDEEIVYVLNPVGSFLCPSTLDVNY